MTEPLSAPKDIDPKRKAYAFERSLGIPPAEACRRAGGNVDNGHATKWERAPAVQRWIGYYRSLGQTEEMLAAKRQRVEDELQRIGTANMADFICLTEPEEGKSSLPVLDMTKIYKLPEAQQRDALAAVKTIRYTENGPTFELHGKLEALAQIRDMNGFKAPTKNEHTGKDGGSIEITSDADRARALTAFLARNNATAPAS